LDKNMSDSTSNILVGVDFSEGSARALRYAARLAMQTGARLHVLHVHGAPPPLLPSPLAGLSLEAYKQYLNDVQAQLRAQLSHLIDKEVTEASAGQIPVSQSLREGDARREILDAASELKADLVIVGSHGRGAVLRTLMGSVSTSLCQHSAVPILVVPDPTRGV
jgi:nucleotide-binding universal stress UspA family protein